MAKISFYIVAFAFNFIFVQPNRDVSIKNILTNKIKDIYYQRFKGSQK